MDSFKKLGIKEQILESIKEQGFKTPSEVQEKSIGFVLNGKDVIVGAATGSGKTLAFGSGIIQNCGKQGVVQALVLVPTRELSEQVADALKKFSKYKPLEIAKVYGGVSISNQIQSLKRADVVVATPGRLLDHMERNTVDLDYVEILVLDEADRMLDMGFIHDVERIVNRCPRDRQTLLFSATISPEVINLSRKYMNNPIEVNCESNVDPSKLIQVYYDVADNMKFSLLVHLLKKDRSGLAMVFCNTQRNTDFVARNLRTAGVNALAIHGGHSQDKRKKTLSSFHAKDIDVLVCTDVAARGLDIKGVSHVYNYDFPKESNQYIHRIGRTARAGNEGKAVTILSSRDYDSFSRFVNSSDFQVEKQETPKFEQLFIKIDKNSSWGHRANRGFGGENRGRFNREHRADSFRGDWRREDRGSRGGRGFVKSRGFRGGRSWSKNRRERDHSKRRERSWGRGGDWSKSRKSY